MTRLSARGAVSHRQRNSDPELKRRGEKTWFPLRTVGTQKRRITVGHGKVEIQKQDCHFPTVPTACGARKNARLDKGFDAPLTPVTEGLLTSEPKAKKCQRCARSKVSTMCRACHPQTPQNPPL